MERRHYSLLKRLKRHTAGSVLLAAALTLVIMWSAIGARKDNAQLELQTLEGNPDVLSSISLEGVLKDAYHSTGFWMENGRLQSLTTIEPNPRQVLPVYESPGVGKVIDGRIYEIYNGYPFTITSRNWGILDRNTNVMVARLPNFIMPQYANTPEFGLAQSDGTMYYTLPATLEYKGENGIYRLHFSTNLNDETQPYNAEQLVQFKVNGRNEASSDMMEVLGLEAAGDKLGLVSLEDDRLVVHSYRSSTGEYLGEAVVTGFTVAGSTLPKAQAGANVSNGQDDRHNSNYKAFSDPERQILILCFSRPSPSTNGVSNTWITIGMNTTPQVLDVTRTDFLNVAEDTFYGMTTAHFENGTLYISRTFREQESEGARSYYPFRTRRLMLYAFQNGQQVYKGEIKSGINDDNLHSINLPPASEGLSYDFSEYRYIDQLRIGSRPK